MTGDIITIPPATAFITLENEDDSPLQNESSLFIV